MALIECKSAQHGVPSRWVQVGGITDEEVATARGLLDRLVGANRQVSDAVARALLQSLKCVPAQTRATCGSTSFIGTSWAVVGTTTSGSECQGSPWKELWQASIRHAFGPRSSYPKILCEGRQPVSLGIEYEHPVNQSGPLLGRQCVVWVGCIRGRPCESQHCRTNPRRRARQPCLHGRWLRFRCPHYGRQELSPSARRLCELWGTGRPVIWCGQGTAETKLR